MLSLHNEDLAVEIDLEKGARISSLKWNGLEFVVPPRPSLMDWGWYAMVPWAGRIRDGVISSSAGVRHQLPTHWDPPHAEHGFGFFSAWNQTGDRSCELVLPEPYAGAVARQAFSLQDNSFAWELNYEANGCDLPAWLGFHPWFKRKLEIGREADLNFSANKMLVRGADYIPTGELVSPKRQPWDDAFTGVTSDPSIHWEGAALVRIKSSAPWWVVYSEDKEGICVEPQTAPPDASNLGITGAHSLRALFTFSSG